MIINGDVDLSNSKNLISLGNIKEVKGFLNLLSCKSLKDFGNLKKLYGDLRSNSEKIISTGLLQLIDGNCELTDCICLKTLNKLKKVSGILNLYYCSSLKSLGDLETVEGEFISLQGCKSLKDLGKLKMRDDLIIYVKDSGITKSYVNKNFKEYKKCFNWSQ